VGTGGRRDAAGIAAFGRCGGLSHECVEDGPCVDCAPELSCNRINAYHYQCEPQRPEPVQLSAARSESEGASAALAATEEPPLPVGARRQYPRPRWAACGGINTSGCGKDEACFTCADPTFSCKRGSEYYYQCEPNQGGQEGPPPLPGDAVKRWAPCGGLNTAGCMKDEACFTCEDPTFSCLRQSEWYWGCQPEQPVAPPLPSPGDTVARWAQCGGVNTAGCGKDEACFTCEGSPEFSCRRQSEWYWGCQPEQPPAPKPPLPGDAVANWAACGGLNTAGCMKDEACFTCKDPAFMCSRQSEWYYGCQPAAQFVPQAAARPSATPQTEPTDAADANLGEENGDVGEDWAPIVLGEPPKPKNREVGVLGAPRGVTASNGP